MNIAPFSELLEDKVPGTLYCLGFFNRVKTINDFVPIDQIKREDDVYVLSKKFYDNSLWRKSTGSEYRDYGRPTSYQVLWQKYVE